MGNGSQRLCFPSRPCLNSSAPGLSPPAVHQPGAGGGGGLGPHLAHLHPHPLPTLSRGPTQGRCSKNHVELQTDLLRLQSRIEVTHDPVPVLRTSDTGHLLVYPKGWVTAGDTEGVAFGSATLCLLSQLWPLTGP